MKVHCKMKKLAFIFTLFFSLNTVIYSVTDPGDLAVLNEFRKNLENSELLKWPSHGDNDPCGNKWEFVFCSDGRVTQIQAKNLGLKGTLPLDFNKLEMLSNLGLQNNELTGMIPSFNGLKELKFAYLDFNNFTSIPADFFDGLVSLQVMALDHNPNLNGSNGWSLPVGLQDSAQLATLSLVSSNLVGPLPDYLGSLGSLTELRLSMNRISGGIPSSFNGSNLQTLWLNGQDGGGMTGTLDIVVTMESLSTVWLHGNQFSGVIPSNIGRLASLKKLNLNSNQLVGLIPAGLADMELDQLDLNNNHFMGPIPEFKTKNVTYDSNNFCQKTQGALCAPEVMALIEFLGGLEYPSILSTSWSTNNPCVGWLGVICNDNKQVSVINLPNRGLNGTLSPSLGKLKSLEKIILDNNNITGQVPSNWTALKSLTTVDLSKNKLSPPWPKFSKNVKIVIDGNSRLILPPQSQPSAPNGQSSPSKGSGSSPDSSHGSSQASETRNPPRFNMVAIIAPVAAFSALLLMVVPLSIYLCKRKKHVHQAPESFVIHPRDPSDTDNTVKVVVANNIAGNTSIGSGSGSMNSSGMGESHVIEAGNLVISVQVLRNVTKNFAPENELGRGGFGVVYQGELEDGTKIAVKRMEAAVINNKALDEFQSEIAVLSKVRHRHLVSLLGYSVEGNERILVYEYMPQGALSRHLFHWKTYNLEPLSWKRRLNIALDVARGMEYLHSLAHQSFIHRDLKPSNILLCDDFRAKVADFGLVKLAPDQGQQSVVTRLAGTFGYLAPEYAVTGKITTKTDVFSFGVVLMELLMGVMALDDKRPEEQQYLAAWFWRIKSDREKLLASIDPVLDVKGETVESIVAIAELAGHCTAREPNQRPDMGHAVNVLAPLVEIWKPWDDDSEEYSGIDYSLPLNQMVKGWQEAEGKDMSYADLEDSKGSIPARPTGFAESFTSADGR
ncbi:receptor protein kinase TMK1-like [Chenopodium quinoa]|uniref:non-specific serine/threonine protein kinase n=1 Tax=Chenopodium quinoa TaxID=63459 RepID=A0A803MK13_CHEQI|nr:receptor protein kinase TMK1-like [Chenopodium quinoa]